MDIADTAPEDYPRHIAFRDHVTPLLHQRDAESPTLRMLTSPLSFKEHVLKSSRGSNERRNRVRTSSIVTNPYEKTESGEHTGQDATQRGRQMKHSKYSPSPSIKRGKAERLIKEHGSPPGVRVTAGGRIVPNGLTSNESPRRHRFDPLQYCPNRYGAPITNSSNTSQAMRPMEGLVVDIGNGILCQYVSGEFLPLESSNGFLQLYMQAPNLPSQPSTAAMGLQFGPHHARYFSPSRLLCGDHSETLEQQTNSSELAYSVAPTNREIHAMQQFHTKLEAELKSLDRNEVLHRDSLTTAKRSEIVRARVNLVNRLDDSRRAIANAKKLAVHTLDRKVSNNDSQPKYTMQFEEPRALRKDFSTVSPGQDAILAYPLQMSGVGGLAPTFYGNVHGQLAQLEMDRAYYYDLHASSLQSNIAPLQEKIQNTEERGKVSAKSKTTSREDHFKAVPQRPASLAFDGSFQYPRRSHAVEIKAPNNEAEKGKYTLNPTSPSYYPAHLGFEKVEPTDENSVNQTFVPSPTLVTSVTNLVQSPEQEKQSMEKSTLFGNDLSDSSATTADFFPHDAYQYSTKKTHRNGQEVSSNLSSWMPKEGETERDATRETMSGPPNKFIFNDESPKDHSRHQVQSKAIGQSERGTVYSKLAHDTKALQFQSRSRSDGTVRELNSYTSVRDSESGFPGERSYASTAALLDGTSSLDAPSQMGFDRTYDGKAEVRSEAVRGITYKSSAYWAGYHVGLHRDLLEDHQDADYRIGYRDGLLKSSTQPVSAPLNATGGDNQGSGLLFASQNENRRSTTKRVPTVAKSVSFPTFGIPQTPIPLVPDPPVNSLATTPTRSKFGAQEWKNSQDTPLDSPTARADFLAQPNVTIPSPHAAQSGSKRFSTWLADSARTSPLTTRYIDSNDNTRDVDQDTSTTLKMFKNDEAYDQQRCRKSSSSVAQNNDQVHASFPTIHRIDTYSKPGTETESSPKSARTAGMEKLKCKVNGSPIRERPSIASSAVATMMHIAAINAKRPDQRRPETPVRKDSKKHKGHEPIKPSPNSPKKEPRKPWGFAFRQPKRPEHEEPEPTKAPLHTE